MAAAAVIVDAIDSGDAAAPAVPDHTVRASTNLSNWAPTLSAVLQHRWLPAGQLDQAVSATPSDYDRGCDDRVSHPNPRS